MDLSMGIESGTEQWISHSVLKVVVHKIMIAEDSMAPKEEFISGNNISLCIQSADRQAVERIYNSLIKDERTEVVSPLGKVIFSEGNGIVRDPFGVLMQLMYDKRLNKNHI